MQPKKYPWTFLVVFPYQKTKFSLFFSLLLPTPSPPPSSITSFCHSLSLSSSPPTPITHRQEHHQHSNLSRHWRILIFKSLTYFWILISENWTFFLILISESWTYFWILISGRFLNYVHEVCTPSNFKIWKLHVFFGLCAWSMSNFGILKSELRTYFPHIIQKSFEY